MEFLQNALLLLLLFWTLQIGASWMQWRHYRKTLSDEMGRWSDGFLGAGHSKPRLGAGAVALISVTPDLRVRQLRTLSGIGALARFEADFSATDLTLTQLATRYAAGTCDTAVAKAIRQAISQVEEVHRKPSMNEGTRALAAPLPSAK